MGRVKLDFIPKFAQSESIKHLAKRNRELAIAGKRKLGGWGGATDSMTFGDHACWIDIGPFPHLEMLPSKKDGYEMSPESWGIDYAFLLDNTPANIYPHERIVGEIYWEMHQVRRYDWSDTGDEAGKLLAIAMKLGAYGTSSAHTCPDLMIGLSQGYGHILERVQNSIELYQRLDEPRKVRFLKGLEAVCQSCIRYIKRYADLAEKLA